MSRFLQKSVPLILFAGVGVYTGVKFFEPLVINQLEKDGNLRTDIPVPQYDSDGNRIFSGISAADVETCLSEQVKDENARW
ncbi:unnamed protein product [Kuraishia capsulata CBS 1993]|uniref:Uncharacterized protein n=1 Tax=Kuraishia capsulata CBS 1993 TaxID=1382522 RepID=W6MH22_9ASCO|nr:uncharacterized protein KUCA_T00000905001 [Kuraishia capsulata CBS 1993]CDK24938.1 unnamed protein product [Kuraishia capsulata CBS 1993]